MNRTPQPSHGFGKYFPLLITAVFFALSFIGILHHHPWRDEFQAWLVARDAHSLSELHHNLKYDGHPMLYFLFLYTLSSFSHNPFWMQLFCISISTLTVFLINRYSPFPIVLKILITFGYYIFFEYNLIARGYGLEFLVVTIFCILYKNRYKYYYLVALVLFLLSNTESYGLLLSFSFSVMLLLDYLFSRKLPEVRKIPLAALLVCGAIIIAGMIFSALQVSPLPDNTFHLNYPGKEFDITRAKTILSQIVNSYFALPDFRDPNYWNTNFFTASDIGNGPFMSKVHLLWPTLTLFIFCIYFIRKPLLLFLYALGTLVLSCFFYYTFLLSQRYIGHLFVLLFVCMWLDYYYSDKVYQNKILAWLSLIGKPVGSFLFIAILAISFIGGIGSYYRDRIVPFSNNYLAVDFLKKNNLDKLEMAGTMDYIIEPVAAILDRKIYYFNTKSEGSFIYYNKDRSYDFAPQDMVNYLRDKTSRGTQKIVLIFSDPLAGINDSTATSLVDSLNAMDIHLQLVQSIKSATVHDEHYYIYLAEQKKK